MVELDGCWVHHWMADTTSERGREGVNGERGKGLRGEGEGVNGERGKTEIGGRG